MSLTSGVNKQFDYNKVAGGHYERIVWNDHPVRNFWHQRRFLDMEAVIDSNENTVLLDYGCASGSFLGTFRKPYKKAIGVDIAVPQIEVAQTKYGSDRLSFEAKSGEDLEFPDATFDYIVISEVIEHISREDAERLLKKFHRFLKPSGKLILSTPNYRSLWPLIEFFVNRFSDVDYDHQHIFKLYPQKCRKLLDRCGFRVDAFMTTFVVSPFLAGISKGFTKSLCDWETKYLPGLGSIILLSATKK